jgi:hypothetical protein
MKEYFKPDRSNRPKSQEDMYSKTVEAYPETEISGILQDGRIYINESCIVDGMYWLDHYYFAAADIENFSTEQLKLLIENSGVDLIEKDESVESVSFDSQKIEDAQKRSIWEFKIIRVLDTL